MRGIRAARRRPSAAWTRMLAALVVTVLVVAACSKGGGAKAPSTDARQEAVQYAQCMRDNGVPDFPDPGPDGRFRERSHEQQDDPAFRGDGEVCRAGSGRRA